MVGSCNHVFSDSCTRLTTIVRRKMENIATNVCTDMANEINLLFYVHSDSNVFHKLHSQLILYNCIFQQFTNLIHPQSF